MIIMPGRYKHPSRGANEASDVAVTVNMNAEYNLRLIWWESTPPRNAIQGILSQHNVEGNHDLESWVIQTAFSIRLESIPGHSYRSLPHLPLHMHAEQIFPTFLNVEYLYQTMPSQRPHREMTPVVWNIRKYFKHSPQGYSQLPPTRSQVSPPGGERDSSQAGSSIACQIHRQNSTHWSSQSNSRIADITVCATSTLSATHQWSIYTPISSPATSSSSTPTTGGTSQIVSMCHLESSPTSRLAITTTPPSGCVNLPTLTPHEEARSIIANPLPTWATDMNQIQMQGQIQLQVVSTPQSVVSGSSSIHPCGYSDMTHLVYPMRTLMLLYKRNRRPYMSVSRLEMVCYAMQHLAKALTGAPHSQIIEKFWDTTMQHNNISSIALEAGPKEILKEICWSNGPCWILHIQTGTRFEHKYTRVYPIVVNKLGTT